MAGRTQRALPALMLGAASMGGGGCHKEPAPAERVKVAAAADLAFAFPDVGALYEKTTGERAVFSFGSTGLPERQLAEAAPFDAFAAASASFADDAVKSGACLADSKASYATGRLVVLAGNGAATIPTRSTPPTGAPPGRRWSARGSGARSRRRSCTARTCSRPSSSRSRATPTRRSWPSRSRPSCRRRPVDGDPGRPPRPHRSGPRRVLPRSRRARRGPPFHRGRELRRGTKHPAPVRVPLSSLAPLALSIQIALMATVLAGVLGIGVATLLSNARFPGRELLDVVVTAPIVLPPTVLGYYVLVAIGRRSGIGHA